MVLHEWFKTTLTRLSRKSEVAAAIGYALARWPALMRYCDDDHLEIDNNAAEHARRAVAIGRKNYLFAGSDASGDVSLGRIRREQAHPVSAIPQRRCLSILPVFQRRLPGFVQNTANWSADIVFRVALSIWRAQQSRRNTAGTPANTRRDRSSAIVLKYLASTWDRH